MSGPLANARQELFAQLVAEGKPASTAYAEAGYKPNDSAASRLCGNVKVRDRIDHLLARAARRVEFTLEDAARRFDKDWKFARKEGKPSAAVAASVAKAKLFGLMGSDTPGGAQVNVAVFVGAPEREGVSAWMERKARERQERLTGERQA